MTVFGYVFVLACAVCGYVIWCGSHSLYRAVLGGFALPLVALILFGGLTGRAEIEAAFSYLN